MAYEKQIWNQYDDLKTEEENIENGAVVTDNRMNHIEEGIEAHTTDFKNPHKVTAAQVGLGNVPNYAAATKEEALAGESNDTVMTPSLTKAAAKSYVTKEDVGLSNVTNDEQATKTEFNAHTANKSNPHSVTASQVGAYSKSEADSKLALKANESEVIHNTADETIAGKKSFSDDASFKNLNVSNAFTQPVATVPFELPYCDQDNLQLVRVGNLVFAQGTFSASSVHAAGTLIASGTYPSETIPQGFRPTVVRQDFRISKRSANGGEFVGRINLQPDGKMTDMTLYNSAFASMNDAMLISSGGVWATNDPWPTTN